MTDEYVVATTPTGKVLVISKAEAPDTGWFLVRYGDAFESDTWHDTVESAKEQAAYEYDGLVESSWTTVVGSLEDAVAVARRTGERGAVEPRGLDVCAPDGAESTAWFLAENLQTCSTCLYCGGMKGLR